MLASKPYVIGLTGGIGCGKSEAAQFLESLGAAHLDADAVSRKLTAEGSDNLLQCANAHVASSLTFRIRGLAHAKPFCNIRLRETDLLANLRKHVLAVEVIGLRLDTCTTLRRHLRQKLVKIAMSAHFDSSSISFKYCS